MENTEIPSMEDDIFTPRDTPNPKPSSSRIHFPLHEPSSFRPVRHRPDASKGLAFTPPVRRGSPLNPQNANQLADPRRRAWASDLPPGSPESSLSRHRRNPPMGPRSLTLSTPPDNELEVGVFSDEYDLGWFGFSLSGVENEAEFII